MIWFPKMGRFLDKSDGTLDCLLDVRNGKRVFNIQEIVEDGAFTDYFKDDGYVLLPYIGLNDINDKKIYANSSICEVNYFSSSDWISDYCYFSFDIENLRYTVCLINEKEIVDFEASYFDCIRIVDTIQENKLGLIK